MPRRRRNPLVELANAEIALRMDVEALDRVVRGREEAGVQILAAETVAERARAIVRAATDVGRCAAPSTPPTSSRGWRHDVPHSGLHGRVLRAL